MCTARLSLVVVLDLGLICFLTAQQRYRSGSDAGRCGFLRRDVHLCVTRRHLRVNLWHCLRLVAEKLGVSEKLITMLEMGCWKH